MSKSVVWIVILLLIVGGVVLLSRMDASKPVTQVEKIVPDNALAR